MSKLLLLIAAAVAIYVVLSGIARKRARHDQSAQVESMVPCARCGLNLPRSEAFEASGRFFCSEEHRRLGSS
ncbi:MAG TPA: PP0621 family protein [Burkholderiales bacterium]